MRNCWASQNSVTTELLCRSPANTFDCLENSCGDPHCKFPLGKKNVITRTVPSFCFVLFLVFYLKFLLFKYIYHTMIKTVLFTSECWLPDICVSLKCGFHSFSISFLSDVSHHKVAYQTWQLRQLERMQKMRGSGYGLTLAQVNRRPPHCTRTVQTKPLISYSQGLKKAHQQRPAVCGGGQQDFNF